MLIKALMLSGMILTIAVTVGCDLPVRTIDTFCLKTKIITFDDRVDSLETIRQIREQNAVVRKQCK